MPCANMSVVMSTQLPRFIFLPRNETSKHLLSVHKYSNCDVFSKQGINKDICGKNKIRNGLKWKFQLAVIDEDLVSLLFPWRC